MLFYLNFSYMKRKAFTLIEVLLVLSIISIVVSFGIKYYLEYKEQAKLIQDGMEVAKSCISDLISFCLSHPNKELNPSNSLYCRNPTGYVYNPYTVEAIPTICNGSELPDGYKVIVRSASSSHYHIECIYHHTTQSYECKIEKNS
jgi:prepilin-type N-terminal cleavage/methylation domain-containing protein